MPRRIITFALLLFILCFLYAPGWAVNAESFALSMTVSCPSKAYAGESFFCQVTVHNDDNASHAYTLSWLVDNTNEFNTSGTIGPGETINTGSSFTFSVAEDATLSFWMGYNAHEIAITLKQDGQTVTTDTSDINIVRVNMSLIPTIQPLPVLPNSSFSLNLMVWNEGDEAINVTVRLPPVVGGEITLRSAATADYGQISSHFFMNQTFNFDVGPFIALGEYPIKVWVSYSDMRGNLYSRNYYVTIPVSSGRTAEELGIFESLTQISINELRGDLDVISRGVTMVVVLLLGVSLGLALANFWYSRRTTRSRRKTAA